VIPSDRLQDFFFMDDEEEQKEYGQSNPFAKATLSANQLVKDKAKEQASKNK